MFFKSFGLTALFASAASALPALSTTSNSASTIIPRSSGGIEIVNNLNIPVYLWSVSNSAGDMHELAPQGGNYQEDWRTNPDGGGVSLKLSTIPNQNDVLQFEYTGAEDTIFWDMSCINMGTDSQFTKFGFAVKSSSPQCPTAVCQAGDGNCAAAYLKPDDNEATHGCPIDTNFRLEIGQ